MSVNNLILLGASVGGLHELKAIAAGLPGDLDAAVLIVQHVEPTFATRLPEILGEVSELPASLATDGQPIETGAIYVAPADCHLVVTDSRLELQRGPRENYSRPAIDALFRTAAQNYGPRVTAVVLSGTLGDGTVGLMVVKAHGGTTVVLDPKYAQYSEMPELAIARAPIDHVLPVSGIIELLAQRTSSSEQSDKAFTPMNTPFEKADLLVKRDLQQQAEDLHGSQVATYSCPECGGTLWQIDMEDKARQFRCHVGHIYAPEALLTGMSQNLEDALWSAVRAMVERSTLARQLAKRHRANNQERLAVALEEQAEQDDRQMRLIRHEVLGVPDQKSSDPP